MQINEVINNRIHRPTDTISLTKAFLLKYASIETVRLWNAKKPNLIQYIYYKLI